MSATQFRRRKPAQRALAFALEIPWAITEESLRTILEIAAREHDVVSGLEAVATKLGRRLETSYDVTVRDGVATIPVVGPLFRYANLFTAISGATSYETLATDFRQALEDPAVDAILLSIDSPGGEANGVQELAQAIYEGRGVKPITAMVSGMGASAAYWLASAADEIVTGPTAILGSIGVRMTYLDTRQKDEKAGVRAIEIVSSQSPKKIHDATEPDGRARLQALVDALAEVFVETVAQNRDVEVESVLRDFGAGGVFVGQAAVDAGLADRLGTYESVHAELVDAIAGSGRPLLFRPSRAQSAPAVTSQEDLSMSDTKKPAAGAPAAGAEGQPAGAAAQPETLTTAQVAERHPEAATALRVEGATTERERILAIEAMGIAGHEDVIEAAKKDPAATPEGTAVKLLQAQKAKGQASPAQPAGEPGKQHLANLAGDEAKNGAPGATHTPAGGADPAEQTVQQLVSFATLRPDRAAHPSR